MKKKNIFVLLIGFILIIISFYLMFSNSNKSISFNDVDNLFNEIDIELNNVIVDDKISVLKLYETRISELSLSINELYSQIYDLYKNKDISLFDYIKYKNKIKKYENKKIYLEDLLNKKLSDV